jgi:hypothetical protein
MRVKLTLVLLLTAVMFSNLPSVVARQWKPTPLVAAQEYLNLNHSLEDGSEVFLFWVAPQYVECTPKIENICDNLRRYMVVAIVHYKVNASGEFSFEKISKISVEANSKTYKPLPEAGINPLISSFTAFVGKSISGGLGRMGEGIKFFVFDTNVIDSCSKGVVRVNYLKEGYEFQTPLPGC